MAGRGGSSRAAGTKMKSRRKGSAVGAFLHGICEPARTHAGTCNRTLEYDSLFNWSIEDVNAGAD